MTRTNKALAGIAFGAVLLAAQLLWRVPYTMELGLFVVCLGVLYYLAARRDERRGDES